MYQTILHIYALIGLVITFPMMFLIICWVMNRISENAPQREQRKKKKYDSLGRDMPQER